MEDLVVNTFEKRDLKVFEGSHAQMFNVEGNNRKYELYAQPLFMFASYNNNWEYDDFTDKYEGLKNDYLDKFISTYNSDPRRNKIDYILFDEAIRYVCYTMRALFYDKGYAILIGYKGLGRTITTQLASFMIGNMEVIKFETSKNYFKFLKNFKSAITICGIQNRHKNEKKCIVLKDDDLDDPRVADDINYLFNHGDVPLYHSQQDLEDIYEEIENLNPEMKGQNKNAKYKLYHQILKSNLKVVIKFSQS